MFDSVKTEAKEPKKQKPKEAVKSKKASSSISYISPELYKIFRVLMPGNTNGLKEISFDIKFKKIPIIRRGSFQQQMEDDQEEID